MIRYNVLMADLGWLVILLALVQRDERFSVTGYSAKRYLFIVGVVLLVAVFNLSAYHGVAYWRRLNQHPTIVALLYICGLFFALPIPAALHKTFGANDYFPYGLALGVALLMLAGSMSLQVSMRRVVLRKFGFALLSIFTMCAFAEIALRLTYHDTPYRLIQPNVDWRFPPAEDILPGVYGESVYTTDSYGIRAASPYDAIQEDTYRILAIGSSTTENLYLDDRETWSYLLQETAESEDGAVWVGNVGQSGHRAAHHYFALRHFAAQFDLDMVLVMVGINDLVYVLRSGTAPPEVLSAPYMLEHSTDDIMRVFYQTPPFDGSPVIFTFWRDEIAARLWPENGMMNQPPPLYLSAQRERWRGAPVTLNSLPHDFGASLDIYHDNLELLVDEAAAQGVMLVLMTQPVSWSEHVPDDFMPYLHAVLYQGEQRYSMSVLVDGMAQYNAVLLEVCRENGLTCVDLAAEMNGGTDFFYDDVHLSEAGARRVAEITWHALQNYIPR